MENANTILVDEPEDDWLHELEPDGRHDAERLERAIWRAVIKQALIDATHTPRKIDLAEDPGFQEDARNFFEWSTCISTVKENFETVCEYAGFTPMKVRATALRFLESGVPFFQRM